MCIKNSNFNVYMIYHPYLMDIDISYYTGIYIYILCGFFIFAKFIYMMYLLSINIRLCIHRYGVICEYGIEIAQSIRMPIKYFTGYVRTIYSVYVHVTVHIYVYDIYIYTCVYIHT